jgi:isopentenyl-diphosphate Delta-isomerase
LYLFQLILPSGNQDQGYTLPTASATMSTTTTQTITAQNVLHLFPEVNTTLTACPPSNPSSSHQDDDLSGHDAEQIRLMDEVCIVLDTDDNPLGSASKKTCHLMSNINNGLLHRAFSVFLFHPKTHKLLLQQRASEKITFPDMWTNTCCSHPLAHPAETGHGDLASNVEGAKRAGQRKLGHELGIKAEQVPVSSFNFLTRIHYLAPSDGKWGEHEIDYILFIEAEPDLDINVNEVRDTAWVSPEELKQLFRDGEKKTGKGKDFKYTPWFRLICESLLFDWWDAVASGDLKKYVGESEIRRM